MTLTGGKVDFLHLDVLLVYMIIVLMGRSHCRWSMTTMIVVVVLMLTVDAAAPISSWCSLSHDDDVTVMC